MTNLNHPKLHNTAPGPPPSYEDTVEAYASSHQSRRAVIDMAVGLNPGHLITLATNSNLPIHMLTGQKSINYFHQLLDRQLLGTRYYKKPYEERTHSIAVPEGHRA